MKWNEMEWNGMKWNEMERNGIKWNEFKCCPVPYLEILLDVGLRNGNRKNVFPSKKLFLCISCLPNVDHLREVFTWEHLRRGLRRTDQVFQVRNRIYPLQISVPTVNQEWPNEMLTFKSQKWNTKSALWKKQCNVDTTIHCTSLQPE